MFSKEEVVLILKNVLREPSGVGEGGGEGVCCDLLSCDQWQYISLFSSRVGVVKAVCLVMLSHGVVVCECYMRLYGLLSLRPGKWYGGGTRVRDRDNVLVITSCSTFLLYRDLSYSREEFVCVS